ncbi:nucleotide-diphospho-sugar transferase [Thermoascus aurantiacus ATCC 26904]
MQLLTSKAVRAAVVIAVLLLVVFGLLQLPTSSFDRLRSSTAVPATFTPGDGRGPSSGTVDSVDWSRFAYVQYVTDTAYLCNSVMLFEILHRLGSKADRLMMYPSEFRVDDPSSTDGRLLRKARDEYGVKLVPIQVQRRASNDPTWAESYTKLLVFNQTQYDRVLSLDSDSTVLQTMDELFLLPPCPVAMPRAYWLNPDDRILSSQVLLIQPSEFEFKRVMDGMEHAGSSDYDMEIVNKLYRDSALVLPHRPYDLLTGEFRSKNHGSYMGNSEEPWDPEKILKEAKFLHFSDWPIPKPWIHADKSIIEEKQPKCDKNPHTGEEDDCRARDLWLGFYADFAKRREVRASISPHHSPSLLLSTSRLITSRTSAA